MGVLLIDSSAWIEFFRRPPRVDLAAIAKNDEIVTCLPVVQEVLKGFRDESAYRDARIGLLALPLIESPMSAGLVLEAVDLYRRARRAGLTVRSSVDCLIAACAIRHDLEVLHVDRDYDALTTISALKVRRAG